LFFLHKSDQKGKLEKMFLGIYQPESSDSKRPEPEAEISIEKKLPSTQDDRKSQLKQFDISINSIQWDNELGLLLMVTDSTDRVLKEKLKEIDVYK